MANLNRYDFDQEEGYTTRPRVQTDPEGEWVKFEDIEEYLPSTSDNSESKPLLCPECDSIETIDYGDTGFCRKCFHTWNK